MTTPRSVLVDDTHPYAYHLISRCVRRSFLCGKDPRTGRDYSHRKDWLIDRINQLAPHFSLDIYAYAIMSNHLHLVVYYDPLTCQQWSDQEVAQRWCQACPPRKLDGTIDTVRQAQMIEQLCHNPRGLKHARCALGSLSIFMKLLKQPIARRANREDHCTGHFFEQRFYSGVLLDETAMIDAMQYVDLNPVRARLAKHIRQIKHCSITQRLAAQRNTQTRIETAIAPLFEHNPGQDEDDDDCDTRSFRLPIPEHQYISRLKHIINWQQMATAQQGRAPPRIRRWAAQVAMMGRRQRAYGPDNLLKQWISRRQLQLREIPMPG